MVGDMTSLGMRIRVNRDRCLTWNLPPIDHPWLRMDPSPGHSSCLSISDSVRYYLPRFVHPSSSDTERGTTCLLFSVCALSGLIASLDHDGIVLLQFWVLRPLEFVCSDLCQQEDQSKSQKGPDSPKDLQRGRCEIGWWESRL